MGLRELGPGLRRTVLRVCAVACELCVCDCVCLGKGFAFYLAVRVVCAFYVFQDIVLYGESDSRARTIAYITDTVDRIQYCTVLYGFRLCRAPGSSEFSLFHLRGGSIHS